MTDLVANLQVQVIAGRNLPGKDKHVNPYCKLFLADDKYELDRETKRKTQVCKKTIKPQWDASFSLVLMAKHKYLLLSCWHEGTYSKDTIGEILLPLSDLREPKSGWIALEHKRGSKKKGLVGGDLHVAVQVVSEKTENIKERQKTTQLINRLFKRQITPLDIYAEIPCTLLEKKENLFGTLVATKDMLCFYSERKHGRRKAFELSWWDLVDISSNSKDNLTVTTGVAGRPKETKLYTFEDLTETPHSNKGTIIDTWRKISTTERPKKSKRWLGSGRYSSLRSKRDKQSNDEELSEIADVTDFTQMSDLSVDDDDEVPEVFTNPLSRSLSDAPTMSSVLAAEAKDGSSASESSSFSIHFMAKRATSRYNPGMQFVYIKLLRCHNVPLQSYGKPNTFVETRAGPLLFVSEMVERDKAPLFSEEYLLEVVNEGNIVFSIFHRPEKSAPSSFLGEFVCPLSKIPSGELILLKKKFRTSRQTTRVTLMDSDQGPRAMTSAGRVQLRPCFHEEDGLLRIKVGRFKTLDSKAISENVYLTFKKDSLTRTTKKLSGKIIDFDEEFEFKRSEANQFLVVELYAQGGEKPLGRLSLPLKELHRELPNVWYEIPSTVNMLAKQNSKGVVFAHNPMAEDSPLREDSPLHVPNTSGRSPTQVMARTPLVYVGGVSVLVLLLAVIYMFVL